MTGIAIVGAGFSGTLLAINLLRHDGPRATLIERRGEFGRGVAYSTAAPEHLLNVRSGNMSALPDDPGHFTRWLEERGLPGNSFVPRRTFGDYLGELLDEAVAHAGDRLTIVHGDAVDVAGREVLLIDGRRIAADHVVLAPGNLPPVDPPGLDVAALPAGCYCPDPWAADPAAGLGADDTVLVLGTGLTMVDIALRLDAEGFRGRIVALSRRGLAPQPHAEGVAASRRSERPRPTSVALLRAVRARASEVDWRAAVDELRPYTQSIWGAMDRAERERFLRHLRPWWDVHRHRIAPQIFAKLAAMQSQGRLEIRGGKLTGCDIDGVRYRPRGSTGEVRLRVARIVNGTGPQGDLTRTHEPLLIALRDRGLLRADPLRIGVDVDQDSRAIGRDGAASDHLVMLGPMTRGAFWEIVAVPDIRRQVWSVARRLSNAQWVGGEGL